MYHRKMSNWGKQKISPFLPFLSKNDSIIDLGAGNCLVAHELMKENYKILPVDVKNISLFDHIESQVYDGVTLPYEGNEFQVSLLLTVLHHCDDPDVVIREASRVSSKMVILEDTYNNGLQKKITQLSDTIVNFGHSKMTYQNRSHKEWLETFKNHQLTLIRFEHKSVLRIFQQTYYFLEKQ